MSHQAFMEVILARPDDDTPRLVYADWLDENGDSERAEFIRVQIKLAKLSRWDLRRDALAMREAKLFKTHWREWICSLPDWFNKQWQRASGRPHSWVHFRRGFLDQINCSAEFWFKRSGEFLASNPITSLEIGYIDSIETLQATSTLERIRRIAFTDVCMGDRPTEMVAGIARCANMLALRELSLSFVEHHAENMDRHVFVSEDEANQCLHSLADCLLVKQLERIDLCWYGSATEGLRAFCRSGFLKDLSHLGLSSSWLRFSREDFEVIATLKSPLRSLELQMLNLQDDGIEALLTAPFLDCLEYLNLGNGKFGGGGCFRPNRIGHKGVQAIAKASRFKRLRALDLSGNTFGDDGAAAILGASWLDQLEYLGLHKGVVPVDGSPQFSEPMKQKLRERFGPRVQLDPVPSDRFDSGEDD